MPSLPQLKKQRKEGEKNKPFPLSSSFSLHLPATTKGCPIEGWRVGGKEQFASLLLGLHSLRDFRALGSGPFLAHENCFGKKYPCSARHPGASKLCGLRTTSTCLFTSSPVSGYHRDSQGAVQLQRLCG